MSDTAPPDTGSVSPVDVEAIEPGAYHGWNELRQAINHEVPAALLKVERVNAETLRILGDG